MFTVLKDEAYTVNRATSGTKKSGNKYALVKFIESENQPKGIERPSKSNSAVNVWYAEFPESLKGVKDGALVRIKDFRGFKWIHEEFTNRRGDKDYRDAIELVDAEIEMA